MDGPGCLLTGPRVTPLSSSPCPQVGDTGLDLRSCYLADSRYSNDYTGRLVSDGRNGNMTRYVGAPGMGQHVP